MNIIKVPFDRGGLKRSEGCRKAPDIIIGRLKTYSVNESSRLVHFDEREINVYDKNIEKTNESLNKISDLAPDIILGGDHSITYSCFRSLEKIHGSMGLIVFDAHPDMIDDFTPPTHEDYLRALIENGLSPEKVVLIGVRKIDKAELEYMQNKNIKYFTMKNIRELGLSETIETVMERMRHFDSVYVSVDIDVLDRAFARGTGYPEAGGLSTSELLYMLMRLRFLRAKKVYDFVEANPDIDIDTSEAAAKIISEIM